MEKPQPRRPLSPAVMLALLAHLRRLRRTLLPVSVLCSGSSQTTKLLPRLRRAPGSARIRVLRRHHVRAVHIGICRALLLAMMLLMVLLLAVARTARVILRGRWHLLMLVLGTRGRAKRDLGRRNLLVVLLVLSRGWDGQRGGRRSVSGLGGHGACVASSGRPTTPALLASTRSGLLLFGIFLVFLVGRGSTPNGQPTGDIVRGTGHSHGARRATDGGANRHRRGKGAVWGVETCLDKVFPFGLGDEGLQLGGGECVYEASLGYHQQQDLCASQCRQLISLERRR